jgi:hypothetical protein
VDILLERGHSTSALIQEILMNNGESSNQQNAESDLLEEYFEEDFDLPEESFDDDEIDEEESELSEELPVFDPMEDDFEPLPDDDDDLLDDPLIIGLAVGEV